MKIAIATAIAAVAMGLIFVGCIVAGNGLEKIRPGAGLVWIGICIIVLRRSSTPW